MQLFEPFKCSLPLTNKDLWLQLPWERERERMSIRYERTLVMINEVQPDNWIRISTIVHAHTCTHTYEHNHTCPHMCHAWPVAVPLRERWGYVNVSFVEMLISRECQTCCVSVQGIVVDKILWKLIPKGEIANWEMVHRKTNKQTNVNMKT